MIHLFYHIHDPPLTIRDQRTSIRKVLYPFEESHKNPYLFRFAKNLTRTFTNA